MTRKQKKNGGSIKCEHIQKKNEITPQPTQTKKKKNEDTKKKKKQKKKKKKKHN